MKTITKGALLLPVAVLLLAAGLKGCGAESSPTKTEEHAHAEGEAHGAEEGHDAKESPAAEEGHEHGGEEGHEEGGHEDEKRSTTIKADAADAAGVKVGGAGPATIRETVDLTGRVTLTPSGRAEVKAWYPGRITALKVNIGDRVKKGAAIASIEASESLTTYTITAPITGLVTERFLSVGDVASDQPILVIGNPAAVQAELHVFPRDAERVRPGQPVELRSLSSELSVQSTLESFLPVTEAASQTLTARALIPNETEAWRPGMAVEGQVTVAESAVQVAVKVSGIQRFDGADVVFIQTGDTYEARNVTLGRRDRQLVEVTAGLNAGELYVTDNAFLIRADIEKSGAAHEH